ncbi:MAG: Ig-like domain-containing protein, partial [Cyclobacteriaceae bacterium]
MNKHLLLYIIILIIFQNCANQTQPTGGPQDETPPKLLYTYPESGSVNFTDREIRLMFDEDLQVRNAKNQILITPRTSVDYDIKVRREEVIMEFDSLLDPNTTYTINFRESVQDLTEGNPA